MLQMWAILDCLRFAVLWAMRGNLRFAGACFRDAINLTGDLCLQIISR